MINRLALYEIKSKYAGNLLGTFWMILNPLIQIGIFWLVFGLGIRGGAPVNGVPFFAWLICGLIPWFYMSAGMTQGANSIYSKLGMASKMNFPLSIIPTYVILSQLYTHMILVVIMFIAVIVYHGIATINVFAFLYFMGATTIFLFALSYVTSTFSAIVRDVQQIVQSVVRILFYITPIFWVPITAKLPFFFQLVIKLNPFYYLVQGYRESLLWGKTDFLWSWYTIYFWGIVLILLLVGSIIHVKFRRQFVDYL